ncbi:hypothetical protein HOLleu_21468 [Holothuria leucospilota]|uniref:Ig-like domain-containing protein n=1 Tax=Holothuria leucospilota TaxID=206669 RepID=A0A9Q1H6H7_HOLLE|nr:hypothetical protein HOLleu_21468 [Holothuria leucospilota]
MPRMVTLKSGVIFILAVVFLIIDATFSQQPSCGNSTRNLESGKRAVISCEYALDFIAVFWYRGQENNPFLRRENDRPTTENGFDIDSSGNMIIENVQISNEGSYRITVVDVNGASSSSTVNIYVIVRLKSDPQLESCSTSQHVLCQGIEEEQKTSYLVCDTVETRPAVDFVWSKLSSNGPVEENELRSNSSMNSSTGLLVSASLLKYDRNAFSLQYFSCLASGLAVMDRREAGIFVEGDKEVMEPTESDRTINQGDPFQISCSTDPFQLSKWTITYPNNTVKVLKELYPGEEGGPCLFGAGCYVNKEGVLSIETTTYLHEGSYACTYGDGDTSNRRITRVSVIIKPDPPKIVIEGCSDINSCNKNVALTGTLLASVTGSRPYVEVTCEIAEEAKSWGFFFNEKNEEDPHPDRGTFDTRYTTEYEIEDCREPLPVICKIQGDSALSTLSPSHVNLVTDSTNCRKGKPGLVAFVVILVILIIVAVIIAVILWKYKRGWVQKHLPVCLQPESAYVVDDEREPALKVVKESVPIRDEERGEGEGEQMETEPIMVEEISPPRLPDELLSAFDEFCQELKKTKRVPRKHFEDLMKLFEEHDQAKLPGVLLVNQMVERECENEMFPIVLEFLAKLQRPNWIQVLDVCKLLEELTLSNKLSQGSSITIFVSLFKDCKIALTTFVEVTGKLLKSGKFDEITIKTNLRELWSEGKISQEELVNGILQYVNLYKMNGKTALEEVQNLEKSDNKVPYLLFLREIQKLHLSKTKLQGSCEDILYKLFDDIMTQFLRRPYSQIVHQRVEGAKEAISLVYLQVLILSTVDDKIPLKRACDMLKSGMKNEEVSLSEFKEAYEKCIHSEKLTDVLKRQIPWTFLWLLKEVASGGYFEDTLFTMINSKQLDEMFWIKFIVDLWKMETTKTELKGKLILKVAGTYLMLEKDLTKSLDEVLGRDVRKSFLASIQFNDEEIKKLKKLAK